MNSGNLFTVLVLVSLFNADSCPPITSQFPPYEFLSSFRVTEFVSAPPHWARRRNAQASYGRGLWVWLSVLRMKEGFEGSVHVRPPWWRRRRGSSPPPLRQGRGPGSSCCCSSFATRAPRALGREPIAPRGPYRLFVLVGRAAERSQFALTQRPSFYCFSNI